MVVVKVMTRGSEPGLESSGLVENTNLPGVGEHDPAISDAS